MSELENAIKIVNEKIIVLGNKDPNTEVVDMLCNLASTQANLTISLKELKSSQNK